MSETINETETNTNEQPEETKPAEAVETNEVQRLVELRVAEELKSLKSKLDSAYAQRDEAVKLRVSIEEEKRQAEIKRMEDEGRHKEVAELKLAELKAKVDSLQNENVRLSRDQAVTEAVRGLEFRSELAAEMARDRILSQLVQDENGAWRHKSGVSIKEYTTLFAAEEDNSFLFKAKTNSGTGGAAQGFGTPDTNKQLSPKEQLEALAKSISAGGGLQGF